MILIDRTNENKLRKCTPPVPQKDLKTMEEASRKEILNAAVSRIMTSFFYPNSNSRSPYATLTFKNYQLLRLPFADLSRSLIFSIEKFLKFTQTMKIIVYGIRRCASAQPSSLVVQYQHQHLL